MNDSHGFYLNLAQKVIYVSSEEESSLSEIKDKFSGFLCEGGQPDFRIDLTFRDDIRNNPYTKAIPHNIDIHQFDDYIMVNGSIFTGQVEMSHRRADVALGRNEYAFYLFLRFLTVMLLQEDNGFLIHASSVVSEDGRAYVFMGEPRSGKSAITHLSGTKKILSDDMSIVKKVEDNFMVFPSPFWGSITPAGKSEGDYYAIAGVYQLHRSDENYVRTFKSWQHKLSALHKNILIFPRISRAGERVFRLETEMMEKVRMYKLYFTLTEEVWRCIENEECNF